MATNSQNTFPIVANTVPDDMQCVKDANDVVAIVQQFCQVQGLGGNSGSSFPSQDSVGSQALQLAQEALAQIAAIQSFIFDYRSSPTFGPVPPGTNEIPISWTKPMVSANYLFLLSFSGVSSTALSASFSWWIVQGSQTTTGCTIHFDAAPAASKNWQFSWIAILPPVTPTSTTIISGFSPTSGAVGDAVTIYGTGFTSTQTVLFNGVSTSFTVVSDTEITTTVPVAATTGAITVITGNGTIVSASSFTVT